MSQSESADLVEVATIFSRPEMICFTAALRAEGFIVSVCGDHFINATLLNVACGGYRVLVPAFQRDDAVALIEELRGQTESLTAPDDVRWGVRMLVGIHVGATLLTMLAMAPGWGLALLSLVLAAGGTNAPTTMSGDYLNRRGKLVQMK